MATCKARFYVWIVDYFEGCNYLIDEQALLIYRKHKHFTAYRDDAWWRKLPHAWMPISDEEGFKLLIGGLDYAKGVYEHYHAKTTPLD